MEQCRILIDLFKIFFPLYIQEIEGKATMIIKLNEEQNRLKSIVENAIDDFNKNEQYLLQNNLSERCICAKFAMYLQMKVCESEDYYKYVVDVEYNRGAKGKDYEPKKLDGHDSPITVDLIVHKRGYNKDAYENAIRANKGFRNLICIEMKKSNNRSGQEGILKDKERLYLMTKNNGYFSYSLGVMIIVDLKEKKMRIDEVFADTY